MFFSRCCGEFSGSRCWRPTTQALIGCNAMASSTKRECRLQVSYTASSSQSRCAYSCVHMRRPMRKKTFPIIYSQQTKRKTMCAICVNWVQAIFEHPARTFPSNHWIELIRDGEELCAGNDCAPRRTVVRRSCGCCSFCSQLFAALSPCSYIMKIKLFHKPLSLPTPLTSNKRWMANGLGGSAASNSMNFLIYWCENGK